MSHARYTISHALEKVRPPPGWRLTAYESLDSTNLALRRMVETGAATDEGLVVTAKSQTAGRGRAGRQWQSPPGNLYASILLGAPDVPATAPQLSFVVALAVIDAIQACAPDIASDDSLKCKWPNDVVFRGAKVAGILLETVSGADAEQRFVVVGVGVNVVPTPVPEALYPVTSLSEQGIRVTAPKLLEALLAHLAARVARWRRDGFTTIREAWLTHAAGLGEEITVVLPSETVQGRLLDLDVDGALVVEVAGQRRRILAGDVSFTGVTEG
ncbi:MAG: biotin--[acetyl-CoA-carboxylase] ligase [Rhodospirillaceae bacterium]|nr:biotin--[acetyl-CoA-carboxylase] ligase [Rhodospirillaceae bacterium]